MAVQREGRQRTLSRKALQNAIRAKQEQSSDVFKNIKEIIRIVEDPSGCEESYFSDLEAAVEKYRRIVEELSDLYKQDKYNEYAEEAKLTVENSNLNYALMWSRIIKNRVSDKLLETSSRRSQVLSRASRRSKPQSSISTSSSAKLRALSEAAAAKKSAEFERAIAERELERSQREAEYAREIAILKADQKLAVANAKLEAIEEALWVNYVSDKAELPDIPSVCSSKRTKDWVNSNPQPQSRSPSLSDDPQMPRLVSNKSVDRATGNAPNIGFELNPQHTHHSQPIASTPYRDITNVQLIETLTSTNQQIVETLVRQTLPKCQPDIFSGDPTLFYPWQAAFKAMISDANVSPMQEMNYLRSFTKGDPQQLVDNFRKRVQNNPAALLQSLWTELERRFGSAAVITNSLLERLKKLAEFGEKDAAKLQQFADLCVDVRSQISELPGLGCLNFPIVIQPIAEKLPKFLQSKWEKEIAEHADKHGGAYPSFERFTKLVVRQAKIKNDPNILAHKPILYSSSNTELMPRKTPRKALISSVKPGNSKADEFSALVPVSLVELDKKHCPFHERDGHDLTECKAFSAKSIAEKTDWILRAGLCFRCLTSGHVARECKKQDVKCSICGDERHITLLHKEKQPSTEFCGDENEVNTKCTSTCRVNEGGVSCSKIVLVDVYCTDNPEIVRRVYAILDEQSNSSLISSELADDLGVNTPPERYFLSTCSGEKGVKYGRRVPGLSIRSLTGIVSSLPTMIECDSIPKDKHDIPTPETARRFSHLESIASEIPSLDDAADIHLLIGRDAPELLKVREFKNGPIGTPWAQRLTLGWTIIGQVCLDLVDGPTHVLVHRTSLFVEGGVQSFTDGLSGTYKLLPCPNQRKVTESLANNVFTTTREDNEPSLSCEDRKFLEIMETGIHKNANGNWEMPLPFRNPQVEMPNNRCQAESRLQSLLRTFKRKPSMKNDYWEFMTKIIVKGHATMVPPEEIQPPDGKVFYLSHFGVYHPKKPGSLRVVFDGSLKYQGVSLNSVLLPGPDQMNSLLGVLMRFRKEKVGVMCDVEQMFHSFHVNQEHRNFLRFLWFKDNHPDGAIAEYRMNVHLFGNGSSPAVATFGLRKTVNDGEEKCSEKVKQFVNRNFYVDDGLASLPTAKEAVDLIMETQAALASRNLRLQKVVSNL